MLEIISADEQSKITILPGKNDGLFIELVVFIDAVESRSYTRYDFHLALDHVEVFTADIALFVDELARIDWSSDAPIRLESPTGEFSLTFQIREVTGHLICEAAYRPWARFGKREIMLLPIEITAASIPGIVRELRALLASM